ncbi:MAG: polysaccharide lyase [Patescibacteria group bacterium]
MKISFKQGKIVLIFLLPLVLAGGAGVIGAPLSKKIPENFVKSDAVLLYIDFERAPLDYYEKWRIFYDWGDSLYIKEGVNEGRVMIVQDEDKNRGKVLRILYPEGAFGPKESGAQWLLKLGASYEELYCSYWMKVPYGFESIKGGKLPGLAGGQANTGGIKPNGQDGWSARAMWQKYFNIRQYVYHAGQKDPFYGDGRPWQEEGKDCSPTQGQWHHLETYIKMNIPGKSDGIIMSWLDGRLVMDEEDFRFRDIATLGIDSFYFSTFFGGADESWAPLKSQFLYFDGFVISSSPVHELIFKK